MRYKFTFKKERHSTGLSAIGEGTPRTVVKYNKQEVGYLFTDDGWNQENTGKWYIRFMINKNQEGSNCPWCWTALKECFDSEPEARNYVKNNAENFYQLMADMFKDKVDT